MNRQMSLFMSLSTHTSLSAGPVHTACTYIQAQVTFTPHAYTANHLHSPFHRYKNSVGGALEKQQNHHNPTQAMRKVESRRRSKRCRSKNPKIRPKKRKNLRWKKISLQSRTKGWQGSSRTNMNGKRVPNSRSSIWKRSTASSSFNIRHNKEVLTCRAKVSGRIIRYK